MILHLLARQMWRRGSCYFYVLYLLACDLFRSSRDACSIMVKRSRTLSSSHSSDLNPTEPGPDNGDIASHYPYQKYLHIDREPPQPTVIVCNLPPHSLLSFNSYSDYETHYQHNHTNRCAECYRNFPTELYLTLHIIENHDPITAVRRDRGEKTYACFVEGCSKVCETWRKRKLHLIDKHKFPKDFEYFIVNDGVDDRTSMLRSENRPAQHRSSNPHPDQVITPENDNYATVTQSRTVAVAGEGLDASTDSVFDQDQSDAEMLSNSLQSLKFVPNKVRFGRKTEPLGQPKSR